MARQHAVAERPRLVAGFLVVTTIDEVVATPGALISVRQSGRDGEPLLLLHGGPGVPDYLLSSTAPMLSRLRCIGFDQRGAGRSTCLDGRYSLASYLADIESVRVHLGIETWHVLGHSWGGLLAQAYTAHYPQRVQSLVLVSSSLGVGEEWKRTKRESFRIEHARATRWANLSFYAYGSGLILPGRLGAWSVRHMMILTWHNYFLDPTSAPDPDPVWLAGCSSTAMVKTDRAISKEPSTVLGGVSRYGRPALVLYGAFDILDDGTQIVRRRFPHAQQITLEGSGHLHWLQNPSGYTEVLSGFYRGHGVEV